MIQKFLFLLGFFFGFSLELQVQAAERVQLIPVELEVERGQKTSSALLEEPKNCLNQKVAGPCAIRVGERRKFVLTEADGQELVFSDGAIAVRLGAEKFRLIEGFVRVRGEKSMEIEISNRTSVILTGEAFVERYGDSITVVNTGAKKVFLRTDVGLRTQSDGLISSGLEVHFDRPDVKNGKIQPSAPLPLDLERQVVREAKIHDGPKETFQARVEILLALRKQAAFKAAEIHEEIVMRKLASIESARQEQARIAKVREIRDRELRALFRRKVLNVE